MIPTIQDKTLRQWRSVLAAHKAKRPSNQELERLRAWALEKDSIESAITLLEQQECSRWKTVKR